MRNPVLHMPVQAEKILMNSTLAEPKMALPGTSVWPRYPSAYETNTLWARIRNTRSRNYSNRYIKTANVRLLR